MKNTLNVSFLSDYYHSSPIETLSACLDKQPKQEIKYAPWQMLLDKPEAAFAIAYAEDAIFLKFFIAEKTLKSVYINPNDPVYEDSCVEFFISFNDNPSYYNFEFNCRGTCLLGYGADKKRTLISSDLILTIKSQTRIKTKKAAMGKDLIYWELTLNIPKSVFIHDSALQLKGIKSKANFFKCGDGLPEPHYLAWNNIQSFEPNFHLPAFFGKLNFVI